MEPHTPTPDWHPRATVAKLDGVHGLDLVRTVRDVDPDRLDAQGKVRYLQATERAIAWLSALQADALVACAGRFVQRDEHDVDDSRLVTIEDASRSEVAAATRWSEPWAHDRICTARLLAGPLDATRRALGDGTITPRHADAIASAAQRLSGYADWIGGPDDPRRNDRAVITFIGACRTLQAATLAVAARRGVAATRKAAERALVDLDSTDSRRRRESELRSRDVYVVARARRHGAAHRPDGTRAGAGLPQRHHRRRRRSPAPAVRRHPGRCRDRRAPRRGPRPT